MLDSQRETILMSRRAAITAGETALGVFGVFDTGISVAARIHQGGERYIQMAQNAINRDVVATLISNGHDLGVSPEVSLTVLAAASAALALDGLRRRRKWISYYNQRNIGRNFTQQ